MAPHEHEWTTNKRDGLGWRCECGVFRDPIPAGILWDSVLPGENPADHEHQFNHQRADGLGWRCQECEGLLTELDPEMAKRKMRPGKK